MRILSLHSYDSNELINVIVEHIQAFRPLQNLGGKVVGTIIYTGGHFFTVKEDMHTVLTKLPEN